MKKLLPLIIVLLAGYGYFKVQSSTTPNHRHAHPISLTVQSSGGADAIIKSAFVNHRNNLQVSGQGNVIKILSDDVNGSRHQRFILKLASGQTLLVAHNIDLAPRVTSIHLGDLIQFNGEYEWNEKGGVIHWTHQDPAGTHIAGWLKHQGRTYQ